jgi:hypothetical protein
VIFDPSSTTNFAITFDSEEKVSDDVPGRVYTLTPSYETDKPVPVKVKADFNAVDAYVTLNVYVKYSPVTKISAIKFAKTEDAASPTPISVGGSMSFGTDNTVLYVTIEPDEPYTSISLGTDTSSTGLATFGTTGKENLKSITKKGTAWTDTTELPVNVTIVDAKGTSSVGTVAFKVKL